MQYTIHKLQNGLTVLCDNMPQVESLSIRILFKVGSRHEQLSIDGISHILEHMVFKGTKTRSAKKIAEEFDTIGGYLNAYTSKEKTVYYARVLKDDLNTAIDVLLDIVINSIYDENELSKECNVICQEIYDAEDNPEDVLFEALFKTAFPDHYIGKPIAGTVQSVLSCKRDDLLQYVKQYYIPQNAILSISGNFDTTQAIQIITSKLQSWQSNIKINHLHDVPKYVGGDIRIKKPIEQSHIAMTFNGISLLEKEYYLYQIAAIIAGGSMSSRLFQEIREKRGLAYNISAFSTSYSDCGIWGMYASTEPKSLNELVDASIYELKQMTENITEKEVQIAKSQVKSSLLMSMESSGSRAEKLVNNMAIFGKIIQNEDIVKAIEEITVNDIQKCIKTLLQTTCTVAAIGQIDGLQSYDNIIKQFNI